MSTKKDWKLPLKNWMMKQKSTKNNDNNMSHQKRIEELKLVLSNAFDFALKETSFRSPDVMENFISCYIDVSEYIRFIAFRFQDLEGGILYNRLHGLGLHLENEGLSNVNMNPNYSPMAKLGEGLQEAVKLEHSIAPLSEEARKGLMVSAKLAASKHSVADDVFDLYLKRINDLDHGWVAQALDAWEIENDRRKVHSTDIDNWDVRSNEMAICYQNEAMISELRKSADSLSDIRSFMDSSYESAYNVHGNKSNLSYPEDIKSAIFNLKNTIIDKDKAISIVDQIILEDQLAVRSVRPGSKAAPELVPLRNLLTGRKIFKEEADIDALIADAKQEAEAYLKGKPEFFQQEYERSLEDTKKALSHLKKKPILGRAVTMPLPVS